MPPKAKIPAPIDRPLSRAYLREFSGWSTAFPPGLSEPTSLRLMENMQVNRDGSLRIRPGMRYLSYEVAPGGDGAAGVAIVPFGSAGWKYKQVAMSDTTDYSMSDDSAWPSMTLPAGNDAPNPEGRPVVSSVWAKDTDLWLRRVLPPAESLTFTVEVEDHADVYVNGTLVYTYPVMGLGDSNIVPPIVVEVDSSVLNPAADNVLAIRCGDESGTNNNDLVYVDVQVTVGTAADLGAGQGIAYDRPFVGTFEPFYLADGTKAYLLAVREEDETVGFRVLVASTNDSTMYALDHPMIDFAIPQGTEVLNFSAETTYVKYLQIDNKIFALSDNGEPLRVFKVGATKEAKTLFEITRPGWETADKLEVVHPDAAWITGREVVASRRNRLHNPSFETNGKFWTRTSMTHLTRPQTPPIAPVSGTRVLRMESQPTRTNLATSPLHDVAGLGISGWGSGQVALSADGSYLRLDLPGKADLDFAWTKMLPGVKARERYQVAFDVDAGGSVDVKCRVRFYGSNGAQVGVTTLNVGSRPRWASPGITAPRGAVSMRVHVGASGSSWIKIRNVVVCKASEATGMFHGGSGANYFWTGAVNNSASVYHPPADIRITSDVTGAKPGKALVGSMYVAAGSVSRNATLALRMLNKDNKLLATESTTAAETVGAFGRIEAGVAATGAKVVRSQLRITIPAVPRGEYHYVDAAMIETHVAVAGTYFDGSTPDTGLLEHWWRSTAHGSISGQKEYAEAPVIPPAETRTADTLRATGGKAANPHSFAFFYTFNNEVGESAASRITVRRASRAWSEWIWETPNALGEPSGTATDDPEKCADQLVAYMPQDVFDEAMAEGAISWSLYMFSWSDQDPAPVVALKVAERELPLDAPYGEVGWLRVTPQQAGITEDAPIPSEENRENYSTPSTAGQGLVAGDRMILVNDPLAAAVIRWSSNQIGEYTNFTARKGGGYKTLTSGNLYVPATVKLWQNPQSVDTLCILCLGTDGQSAAYYMGPAQVTSQTDATSFMAFEETTATQGTTSPYGVEVMNNALYHPLDEQLVKSTASNYNINHKSMTDLIENKWAALADKYWIMSAQHDNRLYYLVHNPEGDPLEENCKGNELWVFDGAKDSGTWSRFKIQGHALRKLEYGRQIYMSVIRPDGVYYLDPDYGLDDYVGTGNIVYARPIPWKFETNTQGANRAHDAWAHLQQVSLTLGSFLGQMKWGVKGYDLHGKAVDISKLTRDDGVASEDGLMWDLEDHLLPRRDMKEWHLYGESLEGEYSQGQISLVQYRYTPVSVNVGYEHGSIETFEYARNVAGGNNEISTNGVPVPAIDTRRP